MISKPVEIFCENRFHIPYIHYPQANYTYVCIFYLLYYLPSSPPLTTIKQRMRAIFMSIRLVIVVHLRYQRAICRPSSSAKYPISEMFNWPPYCSPGFLLWSTKKQQIIYFHIHIHTYTVYNYTIHI